MYNFLIRSSQVFIRLFSPVYTSHYVLSLFVIVMWLYSLSSKPFTQTPYILGPTHPPSHKCPYKYLNLNCQKSRITSLIMSCRNHTILGEVLVVKKILTKNIIPPWSQLSGFLTCWEIKKRSYSCGGFKRPVDCILYYL